jgi:hypothetical protein
MRQRRRHVQCSKHEDLSLTHRAWMETAEAKAEVNAVVAWARWLERVQPDAFHSNTYDRVQDTLTLLKERQRSE